MSNQIIITHDKTFHLDEILAIAILLNLYPKSDIIRTRDPNKLKLPNILAVVDVFDVYDPKKNYFDHHQRDFFTTFNSKYKIKLSSSGLIYKHFGDKLLYQYKIPFKYFDIIYEEYFMAIDGNDNGYDIISQIEVNDKYEKIYLRSIYDIIRFFNYSNDFNGALKLVSEDLDRYLKEFSKNLSKMDAIEKCMEKQDGKILVLNVPDRSLDLIYDCEKLKGRNYNYIIVKEDMWRVYAAKKKVVLNRNFH
ncbi:hypothetical protein GVAV_003434 [Gurleya vavrai]